MQKRIIFAAFALVVSATTASAADQLFTAPIIVGADATISAGFGPSLVSDGFHPGTDIEAPVGTNVHAPADGRVVRVHAPGTLGGYHGQVVEINHGASVRTRFSNLEGVTVEPGAEVRAGAVIGQVGISDSPHVHIEVWRDTRPHDPALELTLIAAD